MSYGIVSYESSMYAFKSFSSLDHLVDLNILYSFSHPHLLSSNHLIYDGDNILSLIPIPSYTLSDAIKSNSLLYSDKINILYNILSAIDYLHQNNIILTNFDTDSIIYYDGSYHLCYLDKSLSCTAKGYVSPPSEFKNIYNIPEINKVGLSHKSDIWIFGKIMEEVLGDNIDKNFIDKIMVTNHEERANSEMLLSDKFFSSNSSPSPKSTAIIPEYNNKDIHPNYRDHLKLLIHWAQIIYPMANYSVLFSACDLYYRISDNFISSQSTVYNNIILTCLYLCNYCQPFDIKKLKGSEVNLQDVTYLSKYILVKTQGKFKYSKLLTFCNSIKSLQDSLVNIILSRESNLYKQITDEEIKNILGNDEGNDKIPDGFTIADMMAGA